jgi:hypothetical protein
LPLKDWEELAQDAVAALDRVERRFLEGRALDLLEPVADGGVAPGLDEVAPAEHLLGVDIARALGGPEGLGWAGHGGA